MLVKNKTASETHNLQLPDGSLQKFAPGETRRLPDGVSVSHVAWLEEVKETAPPGAGASWGEQQRPFNG